MGSYPLVDPDAWYRPYNGEGPIRIQCCDCGLVHNWLFRIVKGNVEFNISRNVRSTAQVRRYLNANLLSNSGLIPPRSEVRNEDGD